MHGVVFTARLRLLSTEAGGRKMPIWTNYRPSFDVGGTWQRTSTLNDARISLVERDALAPDEEALVIIEPLTPEFWGQLRVGSTITVQEGSRVVGHATIEAVTHPEGFTASVATFVCRARELVAFVESADRLPLAERLAAARDRLVDLYACACALPLLELTDDSDAVPKALPNAWPGFEAFDLYRQLVDPYQVDPYQDGGVGAGSLSDDLLDVYRDVSAGLALWDSGSWTTATWAWRFSFESHWGNRAVDALRALHRSLRA